MVCGDIGDGDGDGNGDVFSFRTHQRHDLCIDVPVSDSFPSSCRLNGRDMVHLLPRCCFN